MSETKGKFKSGFVAIVGRPNVGKSTLMNQVIGQKIAIMSDKPQTTRNKIHGVYTTDDKQIVFLDTPGIHKSNSKLGGLHGEIGARSARGGRSDPVPDRRVGGARGAATALLSSSSKKVNTPVFLVLNKIDKVQPEVLLPIIDKYSKLHGFTEVVPVSARDGNNVTTLLEQIGRYLPEGPMYYPADQITDHPEQFICAELIREKILQTTREEIPHSIAVEIESMGTGDNGVVNIGAVIYVERPSQKGIIIGKNGAALKEVGKRARHDMERLLGSKIFLELWVKVKEDWRNRESVLKTLGFRHD
ncbi:GTPase Era [Cohnella rhizosphaerae]|uniref:GTPase Era n=1 Tax=Cohnella rhizosphaerae TaxID=1457232 RepID=A0A9X4KVX1_9BACL|nr:GTPase Era [Cohnella rhizosphaerae]MDG0812151.1 GTPase Era [Cohnella rhizosphaerae]